MTCTTELLNLHEAEDLLKMPGLLNKLRRNGNGPPYLKLSPKMIRYTKSELLAWVCKIKVVPHEPLR